MASNSIQQAPRLDLQSSLQQARLKAVTAHATHDHDSGRRQRPTSSATTTNPAGYTNMINLSVDSTTSQGSASGSVAAYLEASAALRRLPDSYSQLPLPSPALHRPERPPAVPPTVPPHGSANVSYQSNILSSESSEGDDGAADSLSSSSKTSSTSLRSSPSAAAEGESETGGNAVAPADNLHDDDMAAKILQSMQRKDAVIADLKRQVEMLSAASARGNAPPLPLASPSTAPTGTTAIAPDTHMESVRGVSSLTPHLSTSPPRRQTTTTSSSVAHELNRKEEELQLLREELSVAQQQWELKEAALEARDREAALLSSHVKKLEVQLDDLLQQKRDDVSTLKEHIEHLQRELKDKAQEVKEKERRHQLELTCLQREIGDLSNQFDAQLGTLQERQKLADDLAEAKRREQEMVFENQQMQRRWLRELEVQKRLVDQLQQQQEQEQESRQGIRGEKTTVSATSFIPVPNPQLLAQQERQLQAARRDVESLRRELHARDQRHNVLATVHARAEEEIARLRFDCQLLTERVSELTLETQQAQAQRDAAVAQAQQLQEALATAESRAQQLAEEHAQQLEVFIRHEDAHQQTVLSQVDGCVRSTEKLEQALGLSEQRRRAAEAAAHKAKEELTEALSAHRAAQAQVRREMLDQQQLATSVADVHKERLHEVHEQLRNARADMARLEQEKQAETSARQASEHARTLAEERGAELDGQVRHLAAAHQETSAALIQTKEELRQALSSQLEVTHKAQELEAACTRLRAHQQQQQQRLRAVQEREQVLCRALQDLVAMVPPSLRSVDPNSHSARTARAEPRRQPLRGHRDASISKEGGEGFLATEVSIDGEPQNECLSVSLSASSTAMAAAPGTHERRGDAVFGVGDGDGDVSFTTTATESVSDGVAGYTRQPPRAAPEASLTSSFSRALKDARTLRGCIGNAMERLATAKRSATSTRAQLSRVTQDKARLEEQLRDGATQHARDTEVLAKEWEGKLAQQQKHWQDRVTDARAATVAECEKVFAAEEAERQRRQGHIMASAQESGARAIATDITAFIRTLPELWAAWLPAVTTPQGASEQTTEHRNTDASVAEETTCLADELVLETPRREIQAECDAIARELLGCAGGYADLATLSVKPSVTGAAAVPPRCASNSSGGATQVVHHHNRTDDEAHSQGTVSRQSFGLSPSPFSRGSAGTDARGIATPPPLPPPAQKYVPWTARQLSELTDVLTSYLTLTLRQHHQQQARDARPPGKGEGSGSTRTVSFRNPVTVDEDAGPLRRADEGVLANALQAWVRSLRGGAPDDAARGSTSTRNPHDFKDGRAERGERADEPTHQTSMLTELLIACATSAAEGPLLV